MIEPLDERKAYSGYQAWERCLCSDRRDPQNPAEKMEGRGCNDVCCLALLDKQALASIGGTGLRGLPDLQMPELAQGRQQGRMSSLTGILNNRSLPLLANLNVAIDQKPTGAFISS
jgi:hypothetical protein